MSRSREIEDFGLHRKSTEIEEKAIAKENFFRRSTKVDAQQQDKDETKRKRGKRPTPPPRSYSRLQALQQETCYTIAIPVEEEICVPYSNQCVTVTYIEEQLHCEIDI